MILASAHFGVKTTLALFQSSGHGQLCKVQRVVESNYLSPVGVDTALSHQVLAIHTRRNLTRPIPPVPRKSFFCKTAMPRARYIRFSQKHLTSRSHVTQASTQVGFQQKAASLLRISCVISAWFFSSAYAIVVVFARTFWSRAAVGRLFTTSQCCLQMARFDCFSSALYVPNFLALFKRFPGLDVSF